MSGAVLVQVRLLVVVMEVVVGPQKVLLALSHPCDPARGLLTVGLLGHHCWAVDVVVLHMGGLDLVQGVNGEVLKVAIGHSTVQQWLGHERGGHPRDVLWDPGLHVRSVAGHVFLQQHPTRFKIKLSSLRRPRAIVQRDGN